MAVFQGGLSKGERERGLAAEPASFLVVPKKEGSGDISTSEWQEGAQGGRGLTKSAEGGIVVSKGLGRLLHLVHVNDFLDQFLLVWGLLFQRRLVLPPGDQGHLGHLRILQEQPHKMLSHSTSSSDHNGLHVFLLF